MRLSILVLVVLLALANVPIAHADESLATFPVEVLASETKSNSGVVCTTANPVVVASGATGYLYPYDGGIGRAGIFIVQFNPQPTTTGAIDLDISGEVRLGTPGNVRVDGTDYWQPYEWSASSSTESTAADVIVTGVTDNIRVTADIGGNEWRLKIINAGSASVDIDWGAFGRR